MRTFYAALPSARRRHLRQEIAEYFFTFGGTRIWTRSHRTPKSWKNIRAKAAPCPCRMSLALTLHAEKSHERSQGCMSDNLNVMQKKSITYVHKSGAIKKESAIPLSFDCRRVKPGMWHIHQRRTMKKRLTSVRLVLLKHGDTCDTA